ncbi:MAG: mitochondrial fission ELM1 family protein [Alphaproteobacteria bacterium]|nr:mitochondrial fission ELM1 family protein [Alphaproteobacteria bacterium]
MSPSSNTPVKILLLSDGRPGHFNLAEGIVAAIERLRPIEVARLEVRRPAWMPARLLSSLVNTGMPAKRIFKVVYRINPDRLGEPDVIVSAGGNTLAANVAAAEITGAANIFYGSLRRYEPDDFSLVMTSYAADATAENRLMWLKPSKHDPEDFVVTERPTRSAGIDSHETGNLSGASLGLIIGGDSGTVRYAPDDWDDLLAFVASCREQLGARFIVANSPRTPTAVSDRLARLAAEANSPITRFIDVRSAGPGTLGILLAGSKAVICTADSSTMLSETVWMQRPVVAVTPKSFILPDNEASYRQWLQDQGWARQLAISDLSPSAFQTALGDVAPVAENPLDALAAELQRRLPALQD